jgi:two-component system, NtrC family, sensor kinase
MYYINKLTLGDIVACRNGLRDLTTGSKSMEEAAEQLVRYFYHQLTDETEKKACVLARLYKTFAYKDLDQSLRTFASKLPIGQDITDQTRCLVLMASMGEKPQWNSRLLSQGHQAIPLPSESVIIKLPMISQLIKQLGLEVHSVIKPNPTMLVDKEEKLYNVFFIADALGSPYIPAQKDFVVPCGVKSVLGFGSLLPGGDLVVTILFLRVKISSETAELFKSLALGTKVALLPFTSSKTWK